jgi:NAD(P)-dependent dehydrogenase (short-subunit alcohol dehydrogenase family)
LQARTIAHAHFESHSDIDEISKNGYLVNSNRITSDVIGLSAGHGSSELKMQRSLEGKAILVTGASRGIGFNVAAAFGGLGAKVGINDLHEADTERAVGLLKRDGVQAISLCGDVTRAADANHIVAQIEEQFGHLDTLVNNAGVLRSTRTLDISDDEWDIVLDGCLKSTFLCSRAAIPSLRRSHGSSIINISSSAGKSVSTIGGPHYTAAKAGVLGLTRHMARELAAEGIRVNAICPGLIDTDMVRSTIPADQISAYAAGFPLRRLGTPLEVANLVIFLASQNAAYITGASYDINGGDLTI